MNGGREKNVNVTTGFMRFKAPINPEPIPQAKDFHEENKERQDIGQLYKDLTQQWIVKCKIYWKMTGLTDVVEG